MEDKTGLLVEPLQTGYELREVVDVRYVEAGPSHDKAELEQEEGIVQGGGEKRLFEAVKPREFAGKPAKMPVGPDVQAAHLYAGRGCRALCGARIDRDAVIGAGPPRERERDDADRALEVSVERVRDERDGGSYLPIRPSGPSSRRASGRLLLRRASLP